MVKPQPQYFYKLASSFQSSRLSIPSAAIAAIQTKHQITMFSAASFSSSHFVVPKVAVNQRASPPTYVRFRQPKVSASYTATAERTMSHIANPASLYDVLGIKMGATCQEIKAAYRRLARVSHPDVVANSQKDTSADEFIKIHAAYATLSDPEKRANYDRTLFRRRRPVSSPFAMSASAATMGSSPASVFSGHSSLRWETDQCW
ncbi:chaperone protein dnaJ 11, chloroplastic-like [Vitis riparia]|uniref:chaperone protein dnaJ 11, chloroplastic-like n=1 Tax=Vitis riparia TaxID=96939 RepID=UPI00155ADFDF|nr:chaperone protein dnaJ 11, chloroplastic-like [Vitis riparia]